MKITYINRKYSVVDMVRFANFCAKNPKVHPSKLIDMYHDLNPPLSDKQRMDNIIKMIADATNDDI